MEWLPDDVVGHLSKMIDTPDLTGTKYELIEEIGRGGMGAVYLVRDSHLDRVVALKVLDSAETDEFATARMLMEAKILAALEHPGIVPIHDAGTLADGRFYCAMKFVKGTRLDRYAASAARSDLLRVFTRICEPVAFAHVQHVVHCDLKPENIMVGEFGEVLVLDWGIARYEAEPGGLSIAGTRGYMAPEQIRGTFEARSDIYALGRILNFLMPGSNVPKALRAIATKAANSDPGLRYASVPEVSADIARFLDGQPISAYEESLAERAARWIAHHKTLSALLLTYILVRTGIFFAIRR